MLLLLLDKDWNEILKRNDFIRGTTRYVVHISCIKTMLNHSTVIEQPLLMNDRNVLCPVNALDLMFQMIQMPCDCPTFCSPRGNAINYWTYNNFIKDIIDHSGLNGDKFSSHSFRRGGCTLEAQSRIIDRKLKKMGDWK